MHHNVGYDTYWSFCHFDLCEVCADHWLPAKMNLPLATLPQVWLLRCVQIIVTSTDIRDHFPVPVFKHAWLLHWETILNWVRVIIWMFPEIVVPPKSSIVIGCCIINHPFWRTPISGSTHYIYIHVFFGWVFQLTACIHQVSIKITSRNLHNKVL